LRHHFWRPEAFRAELARLTSRDALQAHGVPRGLMDALDPAQPVEAQGLVEAYLERSGLELIGTRTLSEIAERLLAEAADARETPLSPETATLIESYTALKAPAHEAAGRIEALIRPHKLDLSDVLAAFRRRLDLLDAAGMDTKEAAFAAEFGRNLEYYTGFVFEIIAPALGPNSPVAGGGRYDSLLADVGAPVSVPAVGSCVHTERLLAVLSGESA
jgi:ATP phosphoribosyltransferase regulatory subunit